MWFAMALQNRDRLKINFTEMVCINPCLRDQAASACKHSKLCINHHQNQMPSWIIRNLAILILNLDIHVIITKLELKLNWWCVIKKFVIIDNAEIGKEIDEPCLQDRMRKIQINLNFLQDCTFALHAAHYVGLHLFMFQ